MQPGLAFFAEPVLNLLFPNAAQGTTILQISSISIVFILLSQTISGALQGIGKILIPAIASGVGVIFKLILNLVLVRIPEIGINGAAFASCICHIVSFIIGFAYLKKYVNLKINMKKYIIKPILATIMMIISSHYIYMYFARIFSQKLAATILIFSAIVIYVILVVLLKIFDEKEIKMLPNGEKIYKFLAKIKIA